MKRAVDMLVGTVLAVAVAPVVLVLAIAVAVQFRAWPFFTQARLGRHGRAFRIVKLRTLPPQAPAYADKYEIRDVDLPWLARMLRRYHLDELPQLWLVPLGRMSLVGPRPEMAFLHEQLDAEVARARLQVRPGCTGLWQVSIHADRLIHEHPEYDLAYVAHCTLQLDAMILWHTLRVLAGRPPSLSLPQALPLAPRPAGTATAEQEALVA